MSVISDAFPRSFQHATVSFGDEQIPILKQHSSPCTSLFFGSFLRLVRLELIAQEFCQLLKAQKLLCLCIPQVLVTMTTCLVWCSISVICYLFARLKELPVEQFPCMQHGKEAALCALPLGNQHSSQSVTLRRRIPFSEVNDKLAITSIFRISLSACCSPLPLTIFFLCFTQAQPLESLKHCFHSPRRSSLLNSLKNLQLETKILHLVYFLS